MTSLPGNPFAYGPDNYRQTLHDTGKSHLAYEISATLALAHEQRTANLIALAAHMDRSDQNTDSYWEEIAERLGLGDTDD